MQRCSLGFRCWEIAREGGCNGVAVPQVSPEASGGADT